MAQHDALTGLPNRSEFREKLTRAVGRLHEGGFAILCLDLDRFKQINDTLGHAAGDILLRAVADRLRSCVRKGDVVARLGGDEFAILQIDVTSHDECTALAQRIISKVNEPYDLAGNEATIGVSIGVALAPSDGSDSDTLLQKADIALYEAFRGLVVDKWSMNHAPGSIVTQSFDFVGKDSQAMSTGSALPGTGIASLTNRIMNSVDQVSNITEGGVSLTGTYAKSFSLALSNNVEGLDAVGTLGNVDFRLGEFNVTLTMSLYLADATYYNKFRNNTATSFSFRITDPSLNAYVVTLPNMRYTTADRPASGRNQALMLSLTGEALKDTTTGYALIVDACGVAVTPWS